MLATVTGGQDAPPVASGRRPVRLENAPGRPENAPGRLSAFVGLAGEFEAAAAAAPTASTSSALVPVIDVAFAVLAMTVPIAMLVFMTLGTTARLALAVWAGVAVAHAMFVGHNANHDALFASRWANLFAASLTSGVVATNAACRNRHNRWHHTMPDAESLAADLRLRALRLSPHHPYRSFHRWQHWYIWFLLPAYLVIAFLADVSFIVLRRDGTRAVAPRPLSRTLGMVAQKVAWPLLVLGPALYLHSWTGVTGIGLVIVGVGGTLFALGSAVGHLVETSAPVDVSAMRLACPELTRADARAARILLTTSDTRPHTPLLSWFLGWGQNHHLAHHLWPLRSPYDLPVLSEAIAGICERRGITRPVQLSLTGAIGAHFRFLRALSQPTVAAV